MSFVTSEVLVGLLFGLSFGVAWLISWVGVYTWSFVRAARRESMLPLLRQSPSDSTTDRRSGRSSTGQRRSGLVALRGPDEIPVLHVQYPNPWRILAERPKGTLWHPLGESNPSFRDENPMS